MNFPTRMRAEKFWCVTITKRLQAQTLCIGRMIQRVFYFQKNYMGCLTRHFLHVTHHLSPLQGGDFHCQSRVNVKQNWSQS